MTPLAIGSKQVSKHHATLVLLIWTGAILRWAVMVPYPYFTDFDVVNFGLAADHFDILKHQPHPPGYIGYVLYLKLIGLWPGLESIEIAKWGSLLMGTACIPLAYWACRQLTDKADSRALWAAALVTVQPVLWFYGSDGQSHSSEAFALLGLFGLAARWLRNVTLRRVALFCLLAGLAGSFRPTVVVSAIPIALWLLWRQPIRSWVAGAAAGAVGVFAWWVPTIMNAGGLDMYQRVSDNLVGKLFLKNYSFLSSEASIWGMRSNIVYTLFAAILVALPVVAWSRGGARFGKPLLVTILASLLFFSATFLSEPGYVTGLCALACLTPASWLETPPRHLHWRAGLVATAFATWFFIGPPEIHVPGVVRLLNPGLRHAQSVQATQELFATLVCSEEAPRTLLLTDRHDNTLTRSASFSCPGLVSGIHLYEFALRKDLDAWVFVNEKTLVPIPTRVPVENGPPADVTLPWTFDRVLVGPGASDRFKARIYAAATCAPTVLEPYADVDLVMHAYPAECLRVMKISAHTIRIADPELR